MSSTVFGSSARAVGLIWMTHSSSGRESSRSCTGGFWENRPSQNAPPSTCTVELRLRAVQVGLDQAEVDAARQQVPEVVEPGGRQVVRADGRQEPGSLQG